MILFFDSIYISLVNRIILDSYDFIDYDNNADPATGLNDHGTSCAGIVAMVRSNDVCGVGVAYDSNVAGIFN